MNFQLLRKVQYPAARVVTKKQNQGKTLSMRNFKKTSKKKTLSRQLKKFFASKVQFDILFSFCIQIKYDIFSMNFHNSLIFL